MQWLTAYNQRIDGKLAQACIKIARRARIDRYRSRTTVTADHINTAYSWTTMDRIENDNLVASESTLKYITRPLARAVDTEEAFTNARDIIENLQTFTYTRTLCIINTSTNAAAAERLQEYMGTTAYTELNVRTLVTSTPNHKIRVYKYTQDSRYYYVILNNVDTPEVVFKLSAAILLHENYFGDATATFVEAYHAGDESKVNAAVVQYFAEFNAHAQERAINNAINNMATALTQGRDNEYLRKIERAQTALDNLYTNIQEHAKILNEYKAEYLMYKLTDENSKVNELTQFLMSTKNNLAHIKFSNNRLDLVYSTPLLYWESEMVRRYFESSRNNVMNTAPEHVQHLLKDLFINNTHTLLIQSGATLDLARGTINFLNPTAVLNVMTLGELNGMFNPHHYYYNCWGDNQSLISRALVDHDYVTAILQTFAAIAGINMTDTAVITRFIERELNEFNSTKCIKVNETGEIIAPAEYYRRLTENASNPND